MSKITQYTQITSVKPNDQLVVVDVNDTTMAPTGTTKNMLLSQFPGNVPYFTNISGAYVQAQQSVSTSLTLGFGSLRLSPLVVTQPFAIAAMGAEFTTAGDTNSVFRSGIYADNGAGYPGLLVLDAGSISCGASNAGSVATGGTPGVYLNTVGSPPTLQPGLYWIGGALQGTATQPSMRLATFGLQFSAAANGTPAAGAGQLGYLQASVTTALPGTFITFSSSSSAGSIPRVIFKVQ